MLKCYHDLAKMVTLRERFEYLKLTKSVGEETFGFDRYLNQTFYRSTEWLRVRDAVIIRDNGCDLGIIGFEIRDKINVHHMNPITIEDIERKSPLLVDPEYLICVSHATHLAIHFGDENQLPKELIKRRPGDTRLW